MNVLLLGMDNFSAIALKSVFNSGHHVCAAITHIKNCNYMRFKSTADYYNIPFHIVENINSNESEKLIISYCPDVILSVHFDRIIHTNIIKSAKVCVNLHPSLLPQYRGMSPFQRVLQFNEKETAISIHYIEESVDTGDIIAQKIIPLSENMYLADLQKIMLNHYPTVIAEALNFIEDGRTDSIKQLPYGNSYYGKVIESDRDLSFCKTVKDAYNIVRAMSKPFYGAFISHYLIWRSTVSKKTPPRIIQCQQFLSKTIPCSYDMRMAS